jgi:hypothetical protein
MYSQILLHSKILIFLNIVIFIDKSITYILYFKDALPPTSSICFLPAEAASFVKPA